MQGVSSGKNYAQWCYLGKLFGSKSGGMLLENKRWFVVGVLVQKGVGANGISTTEVAWMIKNTLKLKKDGYLGHPAKVC